MSKQKQYYMGVPVSKMPKGLLERLKTGTDPEAVKEWDRLLKQEAKELRNKQHGNT